MPDQPEFKSLENVQFNSFSFQRPYSVTLNADAIYYNPNTLGADIKEMDFDVFIDDKLVTHITQDIEAKMPAQSEFTLPVQVKIPLEEVMKDLNIRDLLSSREINYRLDGDFKMGIGKAMVKVPFKYSGTERVGL